MNRRDFLRKLILVPIIAKSTIPNSLWDFNNEKAWNEGTWTPNILDDYEEGTIYLSGVWTRYVRFGKFVQIYTSPLLSTVQAVKR